MEGWKQPEKSCTRELPSAVTRTGWPDCSLSAWGVDVHGSVVDVCGSSVGVREGAQWQQGCSVSLGEFPMQVQTHAVCMHEGALMTGVIWGLVALAAQHVSATCSSAWCSGQAGAPISGATCLTEEALCWVQVAHVEYTGVEQS